VKFLTWRKEREVILRSARWGGAQRLQIRLTWDGADFLKKRCPLLRCLPRPTSKNGPGFGELGWSILSDCTPFHGLAPSFVGLCVIGLLGGVGSH